MKRKIKKIKKNKIAPKRAPAKKAVAIKPEPAQKEWDLAIVGAGPAGMSAAIEAARHRGLRVLLVDENDTAGGQLYKQIHKFFGSPRHGAGCRGFQIADFLARECRKYKVETRLNTACIGVFVNGGIINLGLLRQNALEYVQCKNLIIAAGAKENPLAFPGGTLPNIMGAGALQTLVNIHRVIPGRRVLIVGSGNVGLIVGYQLIQAGMEVAGVVDTVNKCAGYYVHYARLRQLGVPFYYGYIVKEAEGKNAVEKITIARVKEDGTLIPDTEQTIPVDVVCLAVGMSPLVELCQTAGCRLQHDNRANQLVPVHNREMETTVPNIYVAGDCSRVEEASIAMDEGRLAAVSISMKLCRINLRQAAKLKKEMMQSLKELRAYTKTYSSCKKAHIDKTRRRRGGIAVIACNEDIPCNPCRDICPNGAIKLNQGLTSLPYLDQNKCLGCGLCIPYCPGLAIIVMDETYSDKETLMKLPYEFLPLPKIGKAVYVLDKNGKILGDGRVVKVDDRKAFNKTRVISVVVPKNLSDMVRGIKIK